MTLIELLVVLLIVGVLANIALPAMTIMVRKADATHVIGDFKAVRVAVFDYYATTSAYPASTNWGEMPAALKNELPQGFTFDYKGVQYRWQRFTLPDGAAGPRRRDDRHPAAADHQEPVSRSAGFRHRHECDAGHRVSAAGSGARSCCVSCTSAASC